VESKQESKMKKRKGKSEVIIMRKEQMMMHYSISGDRSGDVFRVEMQQRNIKIPRNA
jgi:hypothetical protein